jgi:hypothetical protein
VRPASGEWLGIEESRNPDKKDEAAKEAIDQIEARKFGLRFQGRGHKIYKTALEVNGVTMCCLIFRKRKSGPWSWIRALGRLINMSLHFRLV